MLISHLAAAPIERKKHEFQGYKHYRILISTTASGNQSCHIAELEMFDQGGIDQIFPGSASYGVTNTQPGFPPSNVADGNPGTYWACQDFQANNSVFYVEFPTPKNIKKMAIRSENGYWAPTSMIVQATNTYNGAWETLRTITGNGNWGNSERREWTWQ